MSTSANTWYSNINKIVDTQSQLFPSSFDKDCRPESGFQEEAQGQQFINNSNLPNGQLFTPPTTNGFAKDSPTDCLNNEQNEPTGSISESSPADADQGKEDQQTTKTGLSTHFSAKTKGTSQLSYEKSCFERRVFQPAPTLEGIPLEPSSPLSMSDLSSSPLAHCTEVALNHHALNVRFNCQPGDLLSKKARLQVTHLSSCNNQEKSKLKTKAPEVSQADSKDEAEETEGGKSKPIGGYLSKSNIPSPVVYVSGFVSKFVCIGHLFNLLECFGRIDKGFLQSRRNFALVEFSNIQEAELCVKELNERTINGATWMLGFASLKKLEDVPFSKYRKRYHSGRKNTTHLKVKKNAQRVSSALILKVYSDKRAYKQVGLTPEMPAFFQNQWSKQLQISQSDREALFKFASPEEAIEFAMANNNAVVNSQGLIAEFTFAPAKYSKST